MRLSLNSHCRTNFFKLKKYVEEDEELQAYKCLERSQKITPENRRLSEESSSNVRNHVKKIT